MRAAVVERYGPPEVVSVVDVPDPVAGKGQVLVRVHATTLNSGDARIRGCTLPPRIRGARTAGARLAGSAAARPGGGLLRRGRGGGRGRDRVSPSATRSAG